MTEKTRRQIEAMKQQTIGVEVEMSGIAKNKACKIVAQHFGTENTIFNRGTRWYCKDTQGRIWSFISDGSIHGEGTEMVTPILSYNDIELLQEVVRQLRHAGAKSCPSLGCGVHIHIGANGHTAATLRNLANIMASHEALLTKAVNISANRIAHYCRTVDRSFLERVNNRKPETMSDLANIWYGNSTRGRNEHYHSSRYHMLNLHATFTKGTIEFRLFQFDEPNGSRKGGLHAGQLKSYIQLCLAMSQMAKQVRTASPKPMQMENPCFAMRTWLMRIGFIGEEFKTARDLFTQRLEGDPAFRFGRTA